MEVKSCHRSEAPAEPTFYLSLMFFLPALLLSMVYLTPSFPPPLEPAVAFLFFCWGRSLSRKKHSFSFSVGQTEYVLARREQPSCVDMQTGGCWVDIAFSPLAFSQTPASIKVQMSLFGNFSAHCRIVRAVVAPLRHFKGCTAGIRSSNAYRCSEGQVPG